MMGISVLALAACSENAAPKELLAPCDEDAECASAACVGGVCCGATCDGACETGVCGSDGSCEVEVAGTVCRAAAGLCDVAEVCDGSAPTCPTDGVADEGTVCRAEAGTCDAAELCDGASTVCGGDGFLPATTECGEFLCSGDAAACPTSCAGDEDCRSGALCVSGACTPGRWAFITSATHAGDFGGLTGADAFCQSLADAAGLPGTYRAWLSDLTGSPSTRFTRTEVPWYMKTAEAGPILLADGWTDLTDGSIDALFVRTESGVEVAHNIPFTCTAPDGTRYNTNHCANWSTSTANADGSYGATGDTGSLWTISGQGGPCNVLHRIYCFQQ